jgi:hypothetical protein
MLAFFGSQSEKGDFLKRIIDAFAQTEKDKLPPPGYINLHGELANSMLYSEDAAYTTEDIYHELETTIRSVHLILDEVPSKIYHLSNKNREDVTIWQDVDHLYHRNLFYDLTHVLQLFSERTLAGETLDAKNEPRWKDAYLQVRNVVLLLSDRISDSFAHEGARERRRWLESQIEISAEPDLMRQAAFWAGFSAVAIPEQTGEGPDAHSCAEARTLIEIAASESLSRRVKMLAQMTERDMARMEALISEIKERIDLSCSK